MAVADNSELVDIRRDKDAIDGADDKIVRVRLPQ